MKRIDDRKIMGANPYDTKLWRAVQRGETWVVLDGLENVVAERDTEAEARAWLDAERAKG